MVRPYNMVEPYHAINYNDAKINLQQPESSYRAGI